MINGVYYLATGLWFGAMVLLAIAAAITFKTVRAQLPDLPTMDQNLFAGNIVGNIINALTVVQIICAVVVVICIVLQHVLGACAGTANGIRIVLLILPMTLLAIDRLHVNPTLYRHRVLMRENPQDKAAFDRYHKAAERIAGATMFALGAALLISPFALHKSSTP